MKVFIITGNRGEGKTTFLKKCVGELQRRNLALFGFYANNVKTTTGSEGYLIKNVTTLDSRLLCQRDIPSNMDDLHLADFWFDKRAIETGEQWLKEGFSNNSPVFILDEVGKFELDGYVWDKSINHLLRFEKGVLLMTVRDRFLQRVMEKYRLDKTNCSVIDSLLFTVELVDEIERG